MNENPDVYELLARAEVLSARAAALSDLRRPRLARLWDAHRARDLNDQAQALLDEACRRTGRAPLGDTRPHTVGGIGRTGWQRLQWLVGVWNAETMLWAIHDRRWISAALSLLCMLVCTLWVLPRKPRTIKR